MSSAGGRSAPRDGHAPGPSGSASAWTLVGALVIASPSCIAAFDGRGTPQRALVTFVVAISALWVLGALGYRIMDLLDEPGASDRPVRVPGEAAATTTTTDPGALTGAPDPEG